MMRPKRPCGRLPRRSNPVWAASFPSRKSAAVPQAAVNFTSILPVACVPLDPKRTSRTMKASFAALALLVLASSSGCRTVSCSSPLSSFLFGKGDSPAAQECGDCSAAHGYNLWDATTPGGTGCQQGCANTNYWEASCGCESGVDGCRGSGGCSGGCAAAGPPVGGGSPDGWATSAADAEGNRISGSMAGVVNALPSGRTPIVNSFEIGDGAAASFGGAGAPVVSGNGSYGVACPRCGTGWTPAADGRCRACGNGLARRGLAATGNLTQRAIQQGRGCPARMGQSLARAVGNHPHAQPLRQAAAQHCENGFCNLPAGPQSGAVTYPYYTVRGPRDFFLNNPPSIGP